MNQSRQSRRQFFRTCSGVLTSGAAACALDALGAESTGKSFQLQYILASSLFGTTALGEILPEVKRSGSEYIDIWPRRHADQREQIEKMGHGAFQELLRRHGVKLGISTRYDLGPYRLQDEISFVKKFGGRLIVCGAHAAAGKTVKEKVKSFVASMKTHVTVAEEQDVTIGIENHSGSLINTPDSIRYFGEFADSPKLGIALAPYHLPQEERVIARLITDLGPNMVHFYAWQHGMGCMKKLPKEQEMMQMPGYGPLDFTPVLAAMKKIDYRGWTEVFMHPVPRGIPILEPTAKVTEAINKSREYLAACLKKV